MRHNYQLNGGSIITVSDIQNACQSFFSVHRVIPDTVKLSFHDFNQFLGMSKVEVRVLERGKQYGNFLSIPGGFVELLVQELENETTHGVMYPPPVMIVVESTQIDREFEKVVLNGDDK